MRILRTVLLGVVLCAPLFCEVRAWQGILTLPTYEEGLPDVNPPFDAFASGRFNYPYTLREQLTDRRKPQDWRALFLENEYLKCVVLPDLGGHIYSCTDKTNGAQLFYANPSIKKAQVSYRGSWAAFGVEFNFPVSHNWVTVSPVDFAVQSHPDGSASVWVGNIDRVYGMQWRVELILRPGSTVLEQRMRLYNPGAVRRRYYWWNNAAVESWDDSRIYYPQNFSASHGFTFVDTWPFNSEGLDQSRMGNHVRGFVSQFAHATHEPYLGIYHPRTRAGVAHFAWPSDAPGKKLWSWGADAEGKGWRKALSDNDSAYLEVQSGLFRNQETYAFLEPQEGIEFSEYWMPVREIGGIARANLHAIVNFEHGSSARLGVNVTHAVQNGLVRIRDGNRLVAEERVSLDPARTYFKDLPVGPAYTIELRDGQGALLLSHTEGQYDMAKPSEVKVGPRPEHEFPLPDRRSEGDFLEIGTDHELNGGNLVAWDTYLDGLSRFPESFELHKAAGRLAVTLLRYEEAVEHLGQAQQRRSNDADLHYHLGLAWAGLDQPAKARVEFERAQVFRSYRAAARLELAFLDAQHGDYASALDWTRQAIADSPAAVRLGAVEVALLRQLGREAEARERRLRWLALDPASSALRFEGTMLGGADTALWTHLAADPDRVLELASEYMRLAMFDTTATLTDQRYPAVDAAWTEPGSVLPQQHALVAYYRAFCRQRLGRPALEEYLAAAQLSTRYIFPNRADTLPVLRAALASNPEDASAHALLGSLWMSRGIADRAIAEWDKARLLQRAIPTLHRNLGYALLLLKNDPKQASTILREGLSVDPSNVELYAGLDQALTLLSRPASERAAVLAQFPDPRNMPSALVYSRAIALAESGRFEDARQLFFDRFFAMEEFGTPVAQVYLEVELLRARGLVRAGKIPEAREAIRTIGREVPGLAFTHDGLAQLLNRPRYQYEVGEVFAELGDNEEARKLWQKAAGRPAEAFGPQAVFALLASKRLNPEPQAWRGRVEAALRETEQALRTTGWQGLAHYTRGVLLRELGRTEDAQASFRSAVLTRDRGLSQYLGRLGLAGGGAP
jgi:tetratricopeptide (TPR) repeat protein